MMMKKYKWIALSAVCLLAAGNWNVMAEKGQRPSPEEHKAKMQERFAKMSEELGLSADQQTLMKSQHEKTMQQMKSIREDDSLSREQKMEQMKALKESSKSAMSSYLTAEQMQKLEEMRAERQAKREEMGDKKGGHPGKKKGDQGNSSQD